MAEHTNPEIFDENEETPSAPEPPINPDLLIQCTPQELEDISDQWMAYIYHRYRQSEITPQVPAAFRVHLAVTQMLLIFGMPANLKGYHYLHTAILKLYGNSLLLNQITTQLYPMVAATHATTAANVERAIRTVINYAWTCGKLRTVLESKDSGLPMMKDKPTNAALISASAERLWSQFGRPSAQDITHPHNCSDS